MPAELAEGLGVVNPSSATVRVVSLLLLDAEWDVRS